MQRHHLLEGIVFAIGIAIGAACATDSNAQAAERIVPEDTAAVARVLAIVRGADPLICEMTARAADGNGSWFSHGSVGGDALMMDSAASAILGWVQRTHNDPALVPTLRVGMRDNDRCVRRIAASLLARVRHPLAVTAMTEALDDAQAGTREVAALGVGMAEAREAAGALTRRLADGDATVRRAAAWSLGEIEEKAALPALIGLLARDPDARVRQAAAWAIGNIR
jgi:HEAT repeat protein